MTAPVPRVQTLLYTSDWSGTRQVYAVRGPNARPALAQLTRARPVRCPSGSPCGYERVAASPDGRRVAYWDFVTQSSFRWQLFVAAADGTGARRVAASTNYFHDTDWAPDSGSLAYAGRDGIHVVRANGVGDVLISHSTPRDIHMTPRWSPDGRRLAYLTDSAVVVLDRRFRRVATVVGDDFAWSPSGRWLAVRNGGEVLVARPDGSNRRLLATHASYGPTAWAAGDRYLAFRHRAGLAIATRATGALRELDLSGEYAWSPTQPLLAVGAPDRLLLVGASSGTETVLAREQAEDLAWAPDGRSLAYLACGVCGSPFWRDRDLRIASVGGTVHTVVPTSGRAGGSITDLEWTRTPVSARYRPVVPRVVALPIPDGIKAPRPIELVATDATRVAYASCGHVFAWTPASGEVVEAGSTSLTPRCNSPDYNAGYGLSQLAVAGDRVASTWIGGGNTTSWWLGATSIPTGVTVTLGEGSATSGGPYVPWRGAIAGLPAGSGDLLVFSTWTEARDPGSTAILVTSQTVRRTPGSGCPCPDLATSPGPLVPYDVTQGRVVAGGDNETRVYDGLGMLVVSVPVSPAAAQLDGSDLVIAVRGTLRVHDAATGVLRHRWSLPDAPVAAPCVRLVCRRAPTTLVFEDAARGLAVYTLNGEAHVVRLADGTDTTVASGTAARFMDAGLVVLNGAELRLLTFGRLPQP